MIDARVYFNGDDCFLAWTMPRTADCWGFAIKRDLTKADGTHTNEYLHNRVGFKGDNNPPNSHKSCTQWPFQRYTWTDHEISPGDTVSYTVSAVIKKTNSLRTDPATAVTVGPVKATPQGDGKTFAYFNRGVVLSQFVARALKGNFTAASIDKFKAKLKLSDDGLRDFLSGDLGNRLCELLAEAKTKSWHVYAALYELTDDELIESLKALGKKAHVVLANGSEKKKGSDGNKVAAASLDGVVDLTRRMLWSEGLGHNKFLVFAGADKKPFMVWTGSTNWASTGLCTQVNNGILVESADVASEYLAQWKRLKTDKRTGQGGKPMHFGEPLVKANDVAKAGTDAAFGGWTAWFTRTSDGRDMDYLASLVNGAKEAILFLMFEPGSNGLLQVVQARLSPASPTYNRDLYLHGVVNTLKKPADVEEVEVDLVSRGEAKKPFNLQVIEPQGVGPNAGLAEWATEVTRLEFLRRYHGIGHAIIHSKVLVIDPFTDPIVVTGSHNFSASASGKNDENFLVIRGNKGLAERYAVNIMSVYQHYRWRAYLMECAAKKRSPWKGLDKSDGWQWKDAPHSAELSFWLQNGS